MYRQLSRIQRKNNKSMLPSIVKLQHALLVFCYHACSIGSLLNVHLERIEVGLVTAIDILSLIGIDKHSW